ncbi:hypothetical protein NKH61_34480 [Mesorhizobium sp. M1005]|uniref:hypothetical protein n=1 Tax=unclassified Mesorhizobium TaxID=325217 RepID=UPI003337F41F
MAALAERSRAICTSNVPDDSVKFDIAGLRVMPIRDEAELCGVRIRTSATIAGARVPVQVDVGLGEPITPEPI